MAGTAKLLNFRTRFMSTGAGTLHHEVQWDSDSGNLADLAHVETRECITWSPAPVEFGASGEYRAPGDHHGLGTNRANGGNAVDDHSIIPPGFLYNLDSDGQSKVWVMNQTYQMRINGGSWQDIPNAQYQITRWYERKGNDLIAYLSKRGIHESVMHRAMASVPHFFR